MQPPISRAAQPILATLALVQRETGAVRAYLFGESSGALRVALFAATHPERVDRGVLSAYPYTGKGSPTLTKRALDIDRFKASPRRTRDQAMIVSSSGTGCAASCSRPPTSPCSGKQAAMRCEGG
jgi:pimeloyl-ACP methyl ester carboxylesterase